VRRGGDDFSAAGEERISTPIEPLLTPVSRAIMSLTVAPEVTISWSMPRWTPREVATVLPVGAHIAFVAEKRVR
jgi:hypothetical protein